MNRLYTMAAQIRNLTNPSLRLFGPACTVKVYPGDNLMVHKSLDVRSRATSSSSTRAPRGRTPRWATSSR